MTTFSEIWKTLSAIDVSDKLEKKQNMSYLPWSWAWGVLMDYYPQATYEFQENTIEKDGTVSVNITMDIDGNRRSMWLPVMGNGNKAIPNPDALIINKNKMRCLVKCIAMYGLGHYIYAGEDLPDSYIAPEPVKPSLTPERFNNAFKAIESGEYTFDKLEADFTLTSLQIDAVIAAREGAK